MLDLIKELALYEKALEKVTVTMEEFVNAGFGENKVWEAFVVEDDGKIVGMALYYIRYSTWRGRMFYLEDFIVKEEYRGKGYGKALFERCIEQTQTLRCHGMTFQVLDWNTPAIEFYKKYDGQFEGEWVNVLIFPKSNDAS